VHDLGTLGGTSSVAFGINARAQVVGSSTDHAALWTVTPTGVTVQDLGVGTAHGINDQGQVVGDATTASGEDHAALWTVTPTGVTVLDLGTLGGNISGADGINARGQVVGISTTSTAPAGPEHAVLWTLRR